MQIINFKYMRIFKDKDKKYTNHLKKYKEKIEKLQAIIANHRCKGDWTSVLFGAMLVIALEFLFLILRSFVS